MKEVFVDKNFRSDSLRIIEQANRIIVEYQALGFTLTLRQLFYQFVSRDIIRNRQTEYKRLGAIINDARLAGLIDWAAIEDRTRFLRTHASWSSPSSIIASAASSYAEDPWRYQDVHVEVWIEKDALVGVIEPVCNRWRLPYFACRGYTSQSEQYLAGKRLARALRRVRKTVILHLGDHDPSGLDMTRDNHERLLMFAGHPKVEVKRLALNMDQIDLYNPPPNPAKETDSRSGPYIAEFGESSWELDALDPPVIDSLIDQAVKSLIDQNNWDRAMDEEEESRDLLNKVEARWDDIVDYLEQNP